MTDAKKKAIRLAPTGNKTLKKFVDSGKSNTPVLTAVDRHLLSRPRDASRRTDVLHPSEIISKDWCHRASYFLLLGHEPAEEPSGKRGLKSNLIFSEGHRIHDKWQSWFWDMGVMFGRWGCQACPYTWWDLSPKDCGVCGSTNLKFLEVPVESRELNIQGRADGWLKNLLSEPVLLEIKSMGPGTFLFEDSVAWEAAGKDYDKAWAALKFPFVKHNLQAQLYLKLLEHLPDAPQKAVFIYESKPNQQVKEFHVTKSELAITPILDGVAMLAEAVKDGTPPECNVKGKQGCWRCEVYK